MVSERVVDIFEAIKVQHQQRQAGAVAVREQNRLLQSIALVSFAVALSAA